MVGATGEGLRSGCPSPRPQGHKSFLLPPDDPLGKEEREKRSLKRENFERLRNYQKKQTKKTDTNNRLITLSLKSMRIDQPPSNLRTDGATPPSRRDQARGPRPLESSSQKAERRGGGPRATPRETSRGSSSSPGSRRCQVTWPGQSARL